MSYILDALTKAAQQRDRQAPVVQRLLSPAPRSRSPWSYASVRLLAAVAVGAVLLSSGLIWWLRSAPTEPPPELGAASAPAPAQPSAPAPPPVSARPLAKLEPLPKPAPTADKPSPPSAARADAPASVKPSAPPPAATPPPRMGTPTLEAPAAPLPPAAPPASVARPAGPPESATLRVEALIYAETPAERMVFINGRRYREGESIDGRLRIEEIREDGVELSDQGRRFTLRVSR